jgi:Na+-translocating ferredoxin:NAD+ oxidoreductase subunit C
MAATFKGGIFPSQNKKITSEKGFSNLSIPQIVVIPLKQHSGNPALPAVKAGDSVQEGQLIGKADGLTSSNIHSSVPGKIIEITDSKCIIIETDGRFSASGKNHEKIPWQDLSKESLLTRIFAAGITGMGGDAFPASAKLSLRKDQKIERLIINCAESEPYLTADDMLIRTYPEAIIEGIRIILKILGIENAFIGIEKNKAKAIHILEKTIRENTLKEKIELLPLKTKYPQGAEKQLIISVLKNEVPSGKLPADIGVIVLNVSTVFAIREACLFGKPLFERYVTITGKIFNKPGNYKIRIGTRISDIIEECGGLRENPAKIIMGGPMRGKSVSDFNTPVVKGTSGIIFFSGKEAKNEKYGPCIRCGRCAAACPSRLIPCDLGSVILNSRYDLLKNSNIFDCIICGSCSYVCPAKRPLSSLIKTAQEKIREQKSA